MAAQEATQTAAGTPATGRLLEKVPATQGSRRCRNVRKITVARNIRNGSLGGTPTTLSKVFLYNISVFSVSPAMLLGFIKINHTKL
jgi:hypothetical protein